MRWWERLFAGVPSPSAAVAEKRTKSSVVLEMDALQAELKPFFEHHDFRQKGRHYHRQVEYGLIHVVTLWVAKKEPPAWTPVPGFRTRLYGHFRVDFGIYVKEVREAEWGAEDCVPRTLSEPYCEIRFHDDYGATMHGWYEVRNDEPTRQMVRETIETLALPFFDTFVSRDKILEVMASGQQGLWMCRPWVLSACILWKRGDLDGARECLRAKARQSKDEGHPHYHYLLELADRMGIGPLGV